jgi:small subunit ribosomal protein S6
MLARQYETVTLVNADSGDAGRDKVLTRIREALEKTGGREIRLENWGRRKTAFRLRRSKATKALYLYTLYLGSNKTVAEVERLLKITEEAMLWQTIVLEDRVLMDEFDFSAAGDNKTIMAVKTKEAAEREAADAAARAEREAAEAEQRAAREAEDAAKRAAAPPVVEEAPQEVATETPATSEETEE